MGGFERCLGMGCICVRWLFVVVFIVPVVSVRDCEWLNILLGSRVSCSNVYGRFSAVISLMW